MVGLFGVLLTSTCYVECPSQFPKMADLVGVSAYEFSKGIEFARKPAPHTPQTVAVHLMCVEDMILEEHAWKSGSSVFEVSSVC
jgi:Retinoblastoma-associated protein A domain